MHTKIINGKPVTDRAGAAEYLGIPISTVRQYAKPSQREQRGWPEPIQGLWYALEDLDTYRRTQQTHTGTSPADEDGDGSDPNELLTAEQFALLRGVKHKTMLSYVHQSELDWDRGQHGLLPIPDETRTARHGHGLSRRWKRSTALAWTFPAQPRLSTGRPEGRRPTTQDLAAVLAAAARKGEKLRGQDIAVRLSRQFDPPVSLQTVRRLQAKLRKRDDNPAD